jgi:hypothetical protein
MRGLFSVFTIFFKALNFESMYNFNSFISINFESLTFYLFSLNYSRTQVNISFVISLHVIDRLLKKATRIVSSSYLAPPVHLPLIPFPFISLSVSIVSGILLTTGRGGGGGAKIIIIPRIRFIFWLSA